MRVEADYLFLVYTLVVLAIVLVLSQVRIPKTFYKMILALIFAITMPTFIPGHGEIIMLIPNGAIYTVSSVEVRILGVVSTMVNYFIAWFFLYKVFGLLKNDGQVTSAKSK